MTDQYEGYEEFFKRIGSTKHQSCLLITSREKPKSINLLEDEVNKVYSYQLNGLSEKDGIQLLKRRFHKDDIIGENNEEQNLKWIIESYKGNPLLIILVYTTILEVFNGDISKFKEEKALVTSEIDNIFKKQFVRLFKLEQSIMYWLAINSIPVSIEALQEDIINQSKNAIITSIESLNRRSLIEKADGGYTLQPAVKEYVTEQFLENVTAEIASENFEQRLLQNHALMKATDHEFIQRSQTRRFLEPVLTRIRSSFPNDSLLKERLCEIIEILQNSPNLASYAAGNIINLLKLMRFDFNGQNFSSLHIKQVNFQGLTLQETDFSFAYVDKCQFTQYFSNVLSVTYSPDGKILAMGDTNGEIRLWKVITKEQIAVFKGHNNRVWSITFSSSGKYLASGGDDSTIRIWDIESGTCIKDISIDVHEMTFRKIYSVAFTQDEKYLACGSEDGILSLWDWDDGTCYKSLEGHVGKILSVEISPDNQFIATGGEDKTVRLWRVETSETEADSAFVLEGHTGRIWSVAFNPDSKLLASGGEDQIIRIWDVETGRPREILSDNSSWIFSIDFSHDGKYLATGNDDQKIRIFNTSDWKCSRILAGHSNRIWSIAFNPVNHSLASGSEDQTVMLWQPETKECLDTIQGYSNKFWSVAFKPGESLFAAGTDDGIVRLWDATTGDLEMSLEGHTNKVRTVAFSQNGQLLASGSEDKTVRIWDTTTGECKRILFPESREDTIENSNWVWSVAFSPDNKTIATASDDLDIRIWNIDSDNPDSNEQDVRVLTGHTGRVWAVAFSPNGKFLASGSEDNTIRLWDANTFDLHTKN